MKKLPISKMTFSLLDAKVPHHYIIITMGFDLNTSFGSKQRHRKEAKNHPKFPKD